jgi:hypothetical protein
MVGVKFDVVRLFNPPVTFYEFDGSRFTKAAQLANGGYTTSYQGRMLVLPTGQVLFVFADGATIDVEVYMPKGTYQKSWAPAITSAPSTVTRGNSYVISGTQFNGLSQGAGYGDDAQMATNYSLVRITNDASGHVFYARTHDHSSMGVQLARRSCLPILMCLKAWKLVRASLWWLPTASPRIRWQWRYSE